MKDFRYFETADFILDPDFIRWVQHDLPADRTFWDKFINLYPEKKPAVEESRKILETIDIRQKLITDETIRSEIGQLMQTIGVASTAGKSTAAYLPRRISIALKVSIAAAAMVILALATQLIRPSPKPIPKKQLQPKRETRLEPILL